jgi:replicative DNA helicase
MSTIPDLPPDRLPTSAAREEMRLLATLMLSNCATTLQAFKIVQRSDFSVARHRTLFGVMCDLYEASTDIDAMVVRDRLTASGLLDDIGGIAYLAEILTTVRSAENGVHHAQMVRDAADRRGRNN